MAEISLRGVTKRYPDGTEAVKAVDLEIADGEFMILVGPSGCGNGGRNLSVEPSATTAG
jgi:multiple sugar transport system ATP-binding protein